MADFQLNPVTGELDLVKSDAEIQAIGDARYLKKDGSNADETIDIGSEDFTTTGDITGGNLSGTNTGDQDLSGLQTKTEAHTKIIKIVADLSGVWSRGITTWEIPFTDLGYGITITRIQAQSTSADPTTELNANIMKCDAQTTGAFPGANPTLIKAIDTTTGNYDSGAITESVATGKLLYLLLDADPVDIGSLWKITIEFTILVA